MNIPANCRSGLWPDNGARIAGPKRQARGLAYCIAIALGGLLAGCSSQSDKELPAQYGQGDDPNFVASVNGLTVLADLFTQAGHHVSSASALNTQLKGSADVIVWAPDDFDIPPPKTVQWFDDWLSAKPNRTLIYIGRDFDAAPLYWQKILPQAPAAQQAQIQAELLKAQAQAALDRAAAPAHAACHWFALDGAAPHRDVRTLDSDSAWAKDIDATKIEIELNSRLIPTGNYDLLLSSEGDPIVSRLKFEVPSARSVIPFLSTPASQALLIVNGSFLLNLPLVNHEHRKLAARLIESIGANKQVTFLESEGGGTIHNSSPDEQRPPSIFELFGVWPLGVMLAQWALVLMLFCFSRWPIFGPPRDPPPPPASDFGRHVAALGEALEVTGDRAFAQERWQQFQQQVRGDGQGAKGVGRSPGAARKVRPENFRPKA